MFYIFFSSLYCHQSLSDPNNYHEFCRLLARLKSNYQLGELVKVENYPEVIRLIANFTVTSLQVCHRLLASFLLNIGTSFLACWFYLTLLHYRVWLGEHEGIVRITLRFKARRILS